MSAFPLFSRLPSELRLRIWEFTVEPRTVDVSMSDSYLRSYRIVDASMPDAYLTTHHPLPVTSTPVPAPLQTCRESRRELQKHYQRGFMELKNRDDVEQRYVWVNFEIDIIFIGDGRHLGVYKAVAPQIQRLRFEAELSDEYFYWSSMKDLLSFTNVKEIFVVCMDGMNTWWRALEEHEWPCGDEDVWFIDPSNGKMMRGPENDAMCLQQWKDRNLELGEDEESMAYMLDVMGIPACSNVETATEEEYSTSADI